MSSPAPRSRVKVLIVEDHTLFAESLELALSLEGYAVRRLAVTESSGSSAALLSSALRMQPSIALLDLDLGRVGDGMRLVTPLAKAGTQVVVVTASNDHGRWGECLVHGARKVLSKTRPLNDVLATVRRINQGFPVMDREERESLIAHWRGQSAARMEMQARLALLTPREQAVLGELMLGRTVREIATRSVVSEATVRTQVKSILAKLEVSSQLAAVGLANKAGWRPPADEADAAGVVGST